MHRFGRAVLPTVDLDAAIEWYEAALGFGVVYDEEIFPGFRSVHVGLAGAHDPGVWLFPSDTSSRVEHPSLVLYTGDIESSEARLGRVDADVVRPLQGEPGSRSLQVRDPSGNIIVLAEM